jgi:hypothetical protein
MIPKCLAAQQNITQTSAIDSGRDFEKINSIVIKRIHLDDSEKFSKTKRIRLHLNKPSIAETKTDERIASLFITEPYFGISIQDFIENIHGEPKLKK